jgi:CheY-like chemotaxis protein
MKAKIIMSYFKNPTRFPCLHLDDYSHEIRNPLNGILGMTNILLNSKLDSSQKNIIRNIQRSSSKLQETLNNILDLSKIISGNTIYYPEQILINPYLQKILHELFIDFQLKKTKLCHFVSPDLKPIAIFDPILVRKLIWEISQYIVHICHEPIINLSIHNVEQDLIVEFNFKHHPATSDITLNKATPLSRELHKDEANINYQLTNNLLRLVKGTIEESIENEIAHISIHIPMQYSSLHQIIEQKKMWTELSGLNILFYNYKSDACESIGKYLNHWGVYFKTLNKSLQDEITSIPDSNFDLIGVDISEIRDHEFIILDKIRAHSDLPIIFFKNADKTNSKIISLQKNVVVVYKPVPPQDLAIVIKSVIKSEADALRNWHKSSISLISEYQDTLKILITDDEIINQRVMSEYLGKLQLKADLAANGEQALVWYQEKKYDLIFMDIQMPIMNGIQATQAIRNIQDKHQPYIIAVTADALKGDRKSYEKVGMNDYLLKPVELEDIKRVLGKYIKTLRQQ